MRFKRSQRVQELLLEEISRLIQNGLKDPRIGFVTITSVELTDNLKFARVYVSIMGDKKSAESALEGLQSARGFIRKALGKNLYLRYIPNIDFRIDETAEKVDKINRILNGLHTE
ncbi:MAG: 30S ribosome-binding factor RbfA [Candidatus Nitrohelix vancouverensis]|uniref:Ribosome-binding factor A n=1 Tax=Candidatus Nitrohelix vancouverensis TaxID=2705534 RepID=A0A7T0C4I5_9BACT|nr:MAG: 30S ribosome-binding factor RbfA [Candidatus Nitrohelix vancouverensis]